MSDWEKFFEDFFTYSGRLSRNRYNKNLAKVWIPYAICWISDLLIVELELSEQLPHLLSTIGTLEIFFLVVLIVCLFVFAPRRLHDMGYSGWWTLLMLAMILSANSLTYILLFGFFFWLGRDGTPGKNKYGDPPKD